MNKEIKKYIKYVKKIIPFYSKDKKEFLKLLTQKIIEFSNTHPNLNTYFSCFSFAIFSLYSSAVYVFIFVCFASSNNY